MSKRKSNISQMINTINYAKYYPKIQRTEYLKIHKSLRTSSLSTYSTNFDCVMKTSSLSEDLYTTNLKTKMTKLTTVHVYLYLFDYLFEFFVIVYKFWFSREQLLTISNIYQVLAIIAQK